MGDPASVEDAFKGESGCDDVFPVERRSGISATRARLCRCQACGNEVTRTYNKVHQENHVCRWCGIERRRRLQMRDPVEMESAYRRRGAIPDIA